MFGMMTLKEAKQIEASLTEPEAMLWLEIIERIVTPPAERKPRKDYMAGPKLGIGNERENKIVAAACVIVENGVNS